MTLRRRFAIWRRRRGMRHRRWQHAGALAWWATKVRIDRNVDAIMRGEMPPRDDEAWVRRLVARVCSGDGC